MAVKLNNADNYEPIQILLDEHKYPIAFKNKVDELMEQGAFNSREEAENWVRKTPIECELYYKKHSGLFAIESGAVESCCVYSPYSGKLCEEADED